MKMTSRKLLNSLILLALGSPGAALAQDGDDADDAADLDRMIVTGSRVARPEASVTAPITVLDRAELAATGAPRLADALYELPQIGFTSLGRKVTADTNLGGIGLAGVSNPDLRDLGTARTLVLVNGRRHVGSIEGSTNVDLETIPTDMVERVEIITGGASAIYGSDAISGVINIILDEDYEGLKTRFRYGQSQRGDGEDALATVTWGNNFADGRGNVTLHASYNDYGEVDALDRVWSAKARFFERNVANTGPGDGIPDEILYDDLRFNFSNENGAIFFGEDNDGNFVFVPQLISFDDQGNVIPFDPGQVRQGNFSSGGDGLYFKRWQELLADGDRTQLHGTFRFDLNDAHTFFAEGKYVDTDTINFFDPSFIFTAIGSTAAPPQLANPYVTIDNPFVRDDLRQYMTDNNLRAVFLERDVAEFGQRAEQGQRTTQRFVGGLRGYLGPLEYETSVNWGKTEADLLDVNNLVLANLAAALDVTTDIEGNIICRDPVAAGGDPGCVPLNILGPVASDAAEDYVAANTRNLHELEQRVFNFTLTGSAPRPSWLAGDIGYAFGVEYREEESRFDPDPLIEAGATFQNTLLPTSGEFNVKEFFAEAAIPVLENLPGINYLEIDVAARWADYDTIGSDTTWKVGVNYEPIDSLRFRATTSKAVRAPNIGELFSAPSQTFSFFDDPCDSREINDIADPTIQANRIANCQADGIPSDFVFIPISNTPGSLGGNENLGAEETDALTVGFEWRPTFVEDLRVSADYISIDIDSAIRFPTLQNILDRCYDAPSLENQFCELFSRDRNDPAGPIITDYLIAPVNVQSFEYEAVDLNVNYGVPVPEHWGGLRVGLKSSYVLTSNDQPFADSPNRDDLVGELLTPEWRHNLSLTYERGDFDVYWNTIVIDDQVWHDEFVGETPESFDQNNTGTYIRHDLQVGFNYGQTWRFVAGVDNVTDKNPPIVAQAAGRDYIYDRIGRSYYVGFSAEY